MHTLCYILFQNDQKYHMLLFLMITQLIVIYTVFAFEN